MQSEVAWAGYRVLIRPLGLKCSAAYTCARASTHTRVRAHTHSCARCLFRCLYNSFGVEVGERGGAFRHSVRNSRLFEVEHFPFVLKFKPVINWTERPAA